MVDYPLILLKNLSEMIEAEDEYIFEIQKEQLIDILENLMWKIHKATMNNG